MSTETRHWESHDSQYRWAITASRDTGRLEIHADSTPNADQARRFAGALLDAADWLKSAES